MNDQKRLLDILTAIEAIEEYSVENFNQLVHETKTQAAIMYNLIVIGEAANRVSTPFQEIHPNIPWASLIGTRNVIVHGYDQVRLQIVWQIVSEDLKDLKSLVKAALASGGSPTS